MKKILFILSLAFIGLFAHANPIEVKSLRISELYFDESGNWHLEFVYFHMPKDLSIIDSAFLHSSTHSVQLPPLSFPDWGGVFAITKDFFDEEFHIGRYADTLTLIAYADGIQSVDWLIFGDLPGTHIGFPREGQSIAYISRYISEGSLDVFSKDNSPTIGFPNDTLGMCGTLKGTVYDMEMNPVKNRTFRLDYPFKTDGQGNYAARILSRPTRFFYTEHIGSYDFLEITKLEFVMEPDSLIEADIFLKSPLPVGIPQTEIAKSPISIYPNPVSKGGDINVNIDLPVYSADIRVEILDLSGRLIRSKRVGSPTFRMPAPNQNGAYLISILLDSKPISTHKIIVDE